MLRCFILLFVLFSFSASAETSGAVAVKRGYLIVDVSSNRTGVMNLILKLDQIESIVRSRQSVGKDAEYHILINMDKKHEHINSNQSYRITFTNLARSSMVYRDILQALVSG